VLVKLLVEVFPDLLAIMMATFEEMNYGFVKLSAGWACPHLCGGRVLVMGIERKPFMDKFGDDSSFLCFESFECHAYCRPMDGTRWVWYPWEFGDDVLEVLRFSSFVPESVLHLLRDHNTVYAQVGESGRQSRMSMYVNVIGWRG